MTPLDQHIADMRGCAKAAIKMVKAADRMEMSGNIIEDIVLKTLRMIRDYPNWPAEAWDRFVPHSPTPQRITPPPKKRRKTASPPAGEGSDKEISLDDIQP